MYTIKEIYKTIQGEGAQAGRTAVFVRFTGCNLWSGKEKIAINKKEYKIMRGLRFSYS